MCFNSFNCPLNPIGKIKDGSTDLEKTNENQDKVMK